MQALPAGGLAGRRIGGRQVQADAVGLDDDPGVADHARRQVDRAVRLERDVAVGVDADRHLGQADVNVVDGGVGHPLRRSAWRAARLLGRGLQQLGAEAQRDRDLAQRDGQLGQDRDLDVQLGAAVGGGDRDGDRVQAGDREHAFGVEQEHGTGDHHVVGDADLQRGGPQLLQDGVVWQLRQRGRPVAGECLADVDEPARVRIGSGAHGHSPPQSSRESASSYMS